MFALSRVHHRGFTLLEMLVTIAILGLLSIIAVPMLGHSLKVWRMNQFSRAVLTAHHAARFHAIKESNHVQVRYDLDDEEITFYHCTKKDDNGDCPASNWASYDGIEKLKAPAGRIDIWSVGDLTGGEACMYYKPRGSILKPQDRSGASFEDCPGGTNIGTGVHITYIPNPDPNDDSQHCEWNTIHHLSHGTGNPNFLRYGAYPNNSGAFQNWTAGVRPSCA